MITRLGSLYIFDYVNLCFNIYFYSIHLYLCYFSERLYMCVGVHVCILLCKNEFFYVCIYSGTIAVPASVYC